MVPSVDSSPCCSADEFQATLSWLSPPLGLSAKVGRQGCQETSDSAIWPIRRPIAFNLKQPQELNLFFCDPSWPGENIERRTEGAFTGSDNSWEARETSLRDEERARRNSMSRSQSSEFRVQRSEMEVDDDGRSCLPSAPLQGYDGEAQTLAPLTVSSLPSSNPQLRPPTGHPVRTRNGYVDGSVAQ